MHLHEVAIGDQRFGAFHGGNVVGFGKVPHWRVTRAGQHWRHAHRAAQLGFEGLQASSGTKVGVWLRRVGINDQKELARQVVDHRQFFALQQQNVGATQGIWRAGVDQFFFDVAHGVVAKIACQPTTKPRQARAQRNLETFLIGIDKVQRIGP